MQVIAGSGCRPYKARWVLSAETVLLRLAPVHPRRHLRGRQPHRQGSRAVHAHPRPPHPGPVRPTRQSRLPHDLHPAPKRPRPAGRCTGPTEQARSSAAARPRTARRPYCAGPGPSALPARGRPRTARLAGRRGHHRWGVRPESCFAPGIPGEEAQSTKAPVTDGGLRLSAACPDCRVRCFPSRRTSAYGPAPGPPSAGAVRRRFCRRRGIPRGRRTRRPPGRG